MKKLLLAAMALLVTAGALSAQDTRKWYVSGTLQGDYTRLKADIADNVNLTTSQWAAGTGVAINRMLSDKFSVGLGISYAAAHQKYDDFSVTSHNLAAELGFTYFLRMADRLYYTPEAAVGMLFDISEGADGDSAFMAGISPFGLEFRPCEKVGLRVNIVSLTYTKYDNYKLFRLSAMPTLSVNFRF